MGINCFSCGAEISDDGIAYCPECGENLSLGDLGSEKVSINEVSPEPVPLSEIELHQQKITNIIKEITLTTAHSLEGYKVQKTIEIVTAECVCGINFLYDFFAGVSDIFGGRSDSTQKVLRGARKTCLHELKKEAYHVGANAVIAVDLDYNEFSGGGKSMLFLVASGTAVIVEKNSE